jgi:small subunit ribosomal protein S6
MRTYEMVLVFDPALEVAQIETDLQKWNDLITQNGLPRRWERWGKRRLAYELKGRQYGYYVVAAFDLNNDRAAELERSVRLNTSVIRHLITIVDPDRVPEVNEESVRNLGAGAAPVDTEAPKAEEILAAVPEEILDTAEPDALDVDAGGPAV